jgi:hypothetical protein
VSLKDQAKTEEKIWYEYETEVFNKLPKITPPLKAPHIPKNLMDRIKRKWVPLEVAEKQLAQRDTKCPFTYETCKYAKICRESFERCGDAEQNDCPIAQRWQEFRSCLLLPYWKKRKAHKIQATEIEQLRDKVESYRQWLFSGSDDVEDLTAKRKFVKVFGEAPQQ